MIRTGRVVAALLAAGGVLALSGCGATERTVASFNGMSLSGEDFDAMARAYLAQPDPTADAEAPAPSALDGVVARELLGQVIIGGLITSFLDERGAAPTADVLAAAPIEEWQQELPAGVLKPLQVFALGSEVIGPAVGDEAAALYEAPAGVSGVLCPRLIIVATEEEAAAVVAELEGGADFAELATERSIDPGSAANGGITADESGAECISASAMSPDAPVGAVALTLSPGEWSAPVAAPLDENGTEGWFVVAAREYDEVSDEINRAVGGQVMTEHLQGVNVEVDPMYGRWNPEQFAVVPF